MILIASRATHGVNILNRKQTRDEIIALFKTQMHKLKERLNVSLLTFFLHSVDTLPLYLIDASRVWYARVATFPGKLV